MKANTKLTSDVSSKANAMMFSEDADIQEMLDASRTAVPDYYAKLTIYQKRDEMFKAIETYFLNKKLNNGTPNPIDRIKIENTMITLFKMIKGMITIQVRDEAMRTKMPETYRVLRMLDDLQHRRKSFTERELLLMEEVLIDRLMALNLTNLLKEAINPFKEF
jgi:hypothetical protein